MYGAFTLKPLKTKQIEMHIVALLTYRRRLNCIQWFSE